MNSRICQKDGCIDNVGNCILPGTDNLPVQCAGRWVEDKYYFLEKYLNASCEARRKFSDRGNAVFIDLFSGPGKCIVRNEQREIDSGGIRALAREEAKFNELFYFDICVDNVNALNKRIDKKHNRHICQGDSNLLVDGLVDHLLKKKYRYHFAFVDPFGPDGLKFETIGKLAKLQRMDLLIHFPIGAIKRNLNNWTNAKKTILDEFMGTNEWRENIPKLSKGMMFKHLLDIYIKQLKKIGYPDEGLRMAPSDKSIYDGLATVPVKNTKEVELYVLILASKHKLGQKIWNSVIKINPAGQKELF